MKKEESAENNLVLSIGSSVTFSCAARKVVAQFF